MIPRTYPSIVTTQEELSGRTAMAAYTLVSVSGLTKWIDYIPVRYANYSASTINTYSNDGGLATKILDDVTGLASWVDYIPVYVDNSLTVPWSSDANGYIPIMIFAYYEDFLLENGVPFLLENGSVFDLEGVKDFMLETGVSFLLENGAIFDSEGA